MSNTRIFPTCLAALVLVAAASTPQASASEPRADFLFVGSYHMDNPGRDVHNMEADDVTSERRQAEIREVAALLERYRPTRVFVERDVAKQADLDRRFAETCHQGKPLSRSETEQLGLRIACNLGLDGVIAADWNELGAIEDGDRIDWSRAAKRPDQQERHATMLAVGAEMTRIDQEILDNGTVLDSLRRKNSRDWLDANARSYFHLALLGTPEDPSGAYWMGYWFVRNQMIFNNIVRATEPGDRVLVIYGAGHGNLLRQLAGDSGMYRVHDPLEWLDASAR